MKTTYFMKIYKSQKRILRNSGPKVVPSGVPKYLSRLALKNKRCLLILIVTELKE